MRIKLCLFAILILGACLRFYNLNWDSGHMLHPDERAIVASVDKLKLPTTVSEFMSPQSTWNPHFFAYGSFPMYLLTVTREALSNFNPAFSQYDYLTLIGRVLSALADLFSVLLIYKIASKLFNRQTGLISAFFYAVSVLPIQLSHFFAVDTLLTSFVLATLYNLLRFYEKPNTKTALTVGFFFGLALATKISAIVLISSLGLTLTADFILIFLKKPHKPAHWLPHLPSFLKHLIKYASVIILATALTFIIFEPYALIDSSNFWLQTIQQSALTSNPFYFPYTLQFVGKIPYIYEFKNIFFWGLGPIIATLSFSGFIYFGYLTFNKEKSSQFAKELIILVFFLIYIFIVGRFAVGFMRYMLPVYPLFCLFGAVLMHKLILVLNRHVKSKSILYTLYFILYTSFLIWPLSFIQIYSRPNTRVTASNWIFANIPYSKTLAVEHWDDQLPIGQAAGYNTQTLKLYDPDTAEKWSEINAQLKQTDYIIIASNRLYTPLQKLTDCQKLPSYRCYPITATYYKNLFWGKLNFQQVAEFTSFPTIPILNIPINDQPADENFTVFDHPKIMIFQKK
ncbi:MAG TPA: glycosyltransferase family 39 protein [Candidatus Saccharimonadales bacterium]|nr:glycosyltransferase family 39 protein [Candidatus Saccharimonadales bacterium]